MTRRAVFYVQLVAERLASGTIAGVKAAKITQRFPDMPEPGAVVVRVALTVPEQLFTPLEAHGEIPADRAVSIPLSIEEPERPS